MSRRKGRYDRRKSEREAKLKERNESVGTIDTVFSFHIAYFHGVRCCRDTDWKCSVQNFKMHLFSGTAVRIHKMKQRKFKWGRFNHFVLRERGKIRPIDAPHVVDRQMHKVITKEILLPLYSPSMIYNNGASMEGKGLAFARQQLENDMHRHFRLYGLSGSIIISDFTGFFPNADREIIAQRHDRYILDRRLRAVCDSVIDSFPGTKGTLLGVEPSQVEMVSYPSALDNFMKCQLSLEGGGHYMDDNNWLIPPDLDPQRVLKLFMEFAADVLHIVVSEHKTHIIPFGKPFRFCKAKYQIDERGHILVNGNRDNAKRTRHKFYTFKDKIDRGEMTYIDLWSSVQGGFSYYEEFDDHGRIMTLRKAFYRVFGFSPEHYETFVLKERGRIDALHRTPQIQGC